MIRTDENVESVNIWLPSPDIAQVPPLEINAIGLRLSSCSFVTSMSDAWESTLSDARESTLSVASASTLPGAFSRATAIRTLCKVASISERSNSLSERSFSATSNDPYGLNAFFLTLSNS